MSEVVVFPSALGLVSRRLKAALTNVPVGFATPEPRANGHAVVVRRVGGARHTLVTDAARLAVEAWGKTPEDAEALAQRCRADLLALAGQTLEGVKVARVDDESAPAELPHPSGKPRFTFTITIHLRGAAA